MRFPTRLLAANAVFALLLWAGFWALVTAITVFLGVTGRLTSSAWEVAAQAPRWYALFFGVALVREFMPMYIAHGQTRRRFAVHGLITVALFAPFLAALLVISYLLEGVLYGLADWPHVLTRTHLFTSPTQVPPIFAEYLVQFAAWIPAGAFMGAAFYRFRSNGLLSVPGGAALIIIAESSIDSKFWLPIVTNRLDIGLPDLPLTPFVAGVAVFLVGLLLTWSIIRDIPLRNQFA
ncbi:hypothetical protein AB0K60_24280 [Thermopolyspora sp. NPDC052614]|uniref:hypothetical protein n=1 Tax=Thermopolyspora sp. NPDC052614 TaxID=3155682 RepID=UPI0034317355